MVNNTENSDVAFRCKDGTSVHASRWLLANRCAFFKGLLYNGMLETTSSEIQLVNFSSQVMVAIVEYLYTGTIESHPPVDWKIGCEMVSAAQFFMIPKVDVVARNFLWKRSSSVCEKSVVMEMLSVALEFPEAWAEDDAIILKLVDPIGPDWCDEASSHKLSRSAVEYILVNYRPSYNQGRRQQILDEYFTLRNVVLWHAYQVVPIGDLETRTAVQNALPGRFPLSDWRRMLDTPVDIDGYISDIANSMDSSNSTGGVNSLLKADICKKSLQQMLLHVNLSYIPASMLLKVIHPLQIFSREQLLKPLVQAALHRRVQCSVSELDWKHGSSLRTGGKGEITCSDEFGIAKGTAIAFIPTFRSKRIYEWSFEILKDDTDFIDIGFIWFPFRHLQKGEILEITLADGGFTGTLRIDSKSRCTHKTTNDTACWEDARESSERIDTEVAKNSVVTFILNETEKTCKASFSNSFEAVWEELQEGDYYPVVGFHECTDASVRLKLVRGFDFDCVGPDPTLSNNEDAWKHSSSKEAVEQSGGGAPDPEHKVKPKRRRRSEE